MSDLQLFSAVTMSVVLAVAAWGKLRSPANFRRALLSYRVIPKTAIPVLVVAVPVAELGFGVLQWIEALQPLVGIGMAMMFVAFTLLLLRSLIAGEAAECGCFGTAAPAKVSWFSILRNCVLIGISLLGAVRVGDGSGAALAAVLTGVGTALIILMADQGLALFSNDRHRADSGG